MGFDKEVEFYNIIFKNSSDLIWTIDAKTFNFIEVNPSIKKILGYSATGILGSSLKQITDSQIFENLSGDINKKIEEIESGINEIQTYSFNIRYTTKNGDSLDGELIAFLKKDNKGKITHIQGITKDICKGRNNEAALRQSEEKYNILFKNMQEGICVIEGIFDEKGDLCDGIYRNMNKNYGEFINMEPAEAIGKKVSDIIPGTEKAWWETFDPVVKKGEQVKFQMYHTPTKKWYSVSTFRPKELTFAAIFSDITAEHNSKIRLEEINKKLNQAQRIGKIGDWTFDLLEDEVAWSDATYELLGYKPGEKSPKQILRENIYSEDMEMFQKVVERYIDPEDKEFPVTEVRFVNTDGKLMYGDLNGEFIYDSEGNKVKAFGTVLDITYSKRIEDVLRTSLKLAELIPKKSEKEIIEWGLEEAERLSESQISFFHFIDEEKNIINLQAWSKNSVKNSKIKDFDLQYSLEKSGTWSDCIKERKPVIHNNYQNLKHKKGLPKGHIPLTRYLITPVIIDKKVNIVLGVGNKPTDYTQLDSDILTLLAENIWLVIEQKRAQQKLIEANQAKDKFFSIIAHDLKNPFNALIGFSELLVHDVKAKNHENLGKYGDYIHEVSKRGFNLLVNLLDWSRLQTGKISFEPVEINFKDITDETIQLLSANIIRKDINIKKQIDPEIFVIADANMLATILRNLLSNAIKFTPAGGKVQLKAEKKGNKITYSVSDNGVGIKKSNLKKLFQIDKTISTIGTEQEKGTGLGLILCKEFIEKHKGSIKVESAINKGTKFTFTLPVN